MLWWCPVGVRLALCWRRVSVSGGVAVALRLAVTVTEPNRDLTFVFYECEEVAAERNGLLRLSRERPELLAGDFAVLMEPSNGRVEAGCQGTLRVEVTVPGVRSHSARAWMGDNAVHGGFPTLRWQSVGDDEGSCGVSS